MTLHQYIENNENNGGIPNKEHKLFLRQLQIPQLHNVKFDLS